MPLTSGDDQSESRFPSFFLSSLLTCLLFYFNEFNDSWVSRGELIDVEPPRKLNNVKIRSGNDLDVWMAGDEAVRSDVLLTRPSNTVIDPEWDLTRIRFSLPAIYGFETWRVREVGQDECVITSWPHNSRMTARLNFPLCFSRTSSMASSMDQLWLEVDNWFHWCYGNSCQLFWTFFQHETLSRVSALLRSTVTTAVTLLDEYRRSIVILVPCINTTGKCLVFQHEQSGRTHDGQPNHVHSQWSTRRCTTIQGFF